MCDVGIKKEEQNPILAMREGFNLRIRKLSRINSSEGEVQADRMRKSFIEAK